jgi:lysophospholipase L1-like esterase
MECGMTSIKARRLYLAAAIPLMVCGPLAVGGVQAQPTVDPLPPIRVILVGDSTQQPGTGYGKRLCARFKPEVTCVNMARGGRSSKSYRVEGAWDLVLKAVAEPGTATRTYLLIQFGHNDGSNLPSRHTTMPEFRANMKAYAEDALKVGATPVLITPVTMRYFKNGVLERGLEPWAVQVREVAAETHVTLLDLYADSYKAVQEMGAVKSEDLSVNPPSPEALEAAKTGTSLAPPPPTPEEIEWVKREMAGLPHPPRDPSKPVTPRPPRPDYTHMGEKGAELFSGIVADEIRIALPELGAYLTVPQRP